MNKHDKEKQEALYKSEVVFSWQVQGEGDKIYRRARWLISISSGLILPLFIWLLDTDVVSNFGFWLVCSTGFILIFISRYLLLSDKEYSYQLTNLGIYYTEKDLIPDVAYRVVRIFAWVGIVVCTIAVFMIDLLAFAGAGAFALLSFGMTKFQPSANQSYILIDDRTIVFDSVNDNVLSFTIPEKDQLEYKCCVYTKTNEEKRTVINHLYTLFPNLEVIKIDRVNDQYKHPIYHQEEEKTAE